MYTKHCITNNLSQLMRLWYLSYRRPAKVQASLRACTVSPEPSLFAHIKYGNRRQVWPKIRHLAPLDGCACMFEIEKMSLRRTMSTIISWDGSFVMERWVLGWTLVWLLLLCGLTSQSTAMVMSRWSVNLTTLFLGKLRSKRLTS